MTVAFHSHGLTLRGSEVALLDYALHNQSVLGNQSYLAVADRPGLESHPVFRHWQARLTCLVYRNRAELGAKLQKEGVDVLYQIKPGRDDGFVIPGIRNCIHAMFPETEFHGDVYAYVSPWLSHVMTGRPDRFVPHLVPRHKSVENLRHGLGIPATARVFGRHGAADTFNIPWVRHMVIRHAQIHPEDHFVFLNTERFAGAAGQENIHFLPATTDPVQKARFLATCDAMLHARWHGETFGLAVGEFAVLGKPVITFSGSRERAHLELLGDRALTYDDRDDLEKILRRFERRNPGKTEYDDFADPYTVMGLFQKVFLS
jgi:hypothetical protein